VRCDSGCTRHGVGSHHTGHRADHSRGLVHEHPGGRHYYQWQGVQGSIHREPVVTRAGKTYAVGTLTGRLGSHNIKSTQVMLPAKVVNGSGIAGVAKVCPILHLVLGPLNLNLLGLVVHLNRVVLDITAHSGPGNLLGNLLCGVANLLNQNPVVGGRLSGLLNIVENLVNTPGLLNL
jgi:hypothetical protein